MMAMTPYEKKTLEEIERAFLDVVEPPRAPPLSTPALAPSRMNKVTTLKPQRAGWFSGLKEKIVMKFVCCAPPQALLDDDEILQILAKIEEPAVPVKPVTLLPPLALSRKDALLRRNSASVMPASRVAEPVVMQEKVTLSDSTHELSKASEEGVKQTTEQQVAASSRAHVSFGAMQRVVVSLLALHKVAEARQTERAVLAVQMKWRRRQTTAIAPVPSAPAAASPTLTCVSEPDVEPTSVEEIEAAPLASPKRRRNRLRSHRGTKKTKFAFVKAAATEEVAEAVDSLTQLALTRKRLRSVDLESTSPSVDVERNVHVLFGEEEIDDEDDDVLDLDPPSPLRRATQPVPLFSLQRCASVPPLPTAFRPRPVKCAALRQSQAASTLQRAWRHRKAHQEREIQRRLQQYEIQKQSVMPTIRCQMTLLRKRLEEMKERNSGALVAVALEAPVSPVDDDFGWL